MTMATNPYAWRQLRLAELRGEHWRKPTECITDADLWIKEDGRGDMWPRTERRWRQEADRRGWKPSTSSNGCPREVIGRCAHRPMAGYWHDCWCDEWQNEFKFTVADHPRRWIDTTTRKTVLTCEPYWAGSTDEQLADWTSELQDWCSERGLQLEISDRSPYYPGRTVLLIFRRAVPGARERRFLKPQVRAQYLFL